MLMASQASSKAFLTAFKETLASHVAGAGGIIAGLVVVLGWQLGVFEEAKWAIAVYPAVLISKSVTNGTFSGRLNTALHVGTISPQFAGNMGALGRMFQRMAALTLTTSIVVSIVSAILESALWGLAPSVFGEVFVVVLATMFLGLTVYLFTIPITFFAFKKGLDLDGVAYPIGAAIADVFITLCYALTVNSFFNFGAAGLYTVLLIAILPLVLLLFSVLRNVRQLGFSVTFGFSVLALVFVGLIGSFTGTILQGINAGAALWSKGGTLYFVALFAAFPALIELVGDATLVIGSTATTRLVLGMLRPNFSALKNHILQIIGAWAASIIPFIVVSAESLLATGTFGLSAFYVMTPVLFVTNVFALVVLIPISYAFALLIFKKGLDPDHLVMPIETSLAAMLTSTALFAALLLLFRLAG